MAAGPRTLWVSSVSSQCATRTDAMRICLPDVARARSVSAPGPHHRHQPACKPGSVWPAADAANVTAIRLGRRLPGASSNLPERLVRTDPGTRFPSPPHRSYSVLLPVGFTVPFPLPETRCALAAPFHPCRRLYATRPRRFAFLWHYPWGRPRRTLSGTVCPWSPDFPPRRPFGTMAERPSSQLTPMGWG
jgi:hypothetical protein